MSANEIRIPVAIPDDHEFVRFDPEKGEAVYKKKVPDFAMQRVDKGVGYYYISPGGGVVFDRDAYVPVDDSRAAYYNYDADQAQCRRRAERERARRKLEYIADRLNPEGWSLVAAGFGWSIFYLANSNSFHTRRFEVGGACIIRVNEIYFHSEEAAETAIAAMTAGELRALSLHTLPQ